MICGKDSVTDQLDRVSRSLNSLAVMEDLDRYYYDSNTGEFCKSAATFTNFVASWWGKGAVTRLVQGSARLFSGESHQSFSTALSAVENSVKKVLEVVREEAFREGVDFADRQIFYDRVLQLKGQVNEAANGIDRLMRTSYDLEGTKQNVLEPHFKSFTEDLSERIKALVVEFLKRKGQEEHEIELSAKTEVEKRRILEDKKERIKLITKYEDQIKEAEKLRLEKSLLIRNNEPNPITGLSINDIKVLRGFLTHKVNSAILRRRLEKKIAHDPLNPFLYLRPKETCYPFAFQYYLDKVVIHLKGSKSNGREQKILGKGAFKKVSISVVLEDDEDMLGTLYANGVSVITDNPLAKDRNKHHLKKVADNERHFLQLLNGDRGILKFYSISRYDRVKDKKKIEKQSVLMHYYNLGDLDDYIGSKTKSLTEREKQAILLDVLYGLSSMHSKRVVHMDLKPENILLEDTSGPAKKNGMGAVLSDFGFSCEMGKEMIPAGSPYYMAPEVMGVLFAKSSPDGIGTAADMWSLGCVAWLLFQGVLTPSMEFIKENRLNIGVLNEMNREDALPEPEKGTVLHLIWRMLRPRPEDRITAEEAKVELENLIEKTC